MTGNFLLDSVISVGAIAFMVLLAWAVFRAPPAPVTIEAVRERLAFDEPDFVPVKWLVDEGARAALAQGVDGDFALAVRVGLDLMTRRFAVGGAKISAADGALVIRPSDPGATAVTLRSSDAELWARKLISGALD